VTKPTTPTTEELLLNDLDTRSQTARAVAAHVREIIRLVGEDPEREGLRKTPERYEKALKFLTSGYHQNVDHVLNGATFSVTYDEMVVVKDIEFFSLCEHHLLPFFGKAHVAYLPSNKVIGLSKIARLVNMFARRLQIQERMTSQIADALMAVLEPRGVIVVIEAEHLCMAMRGVRKPGAKTVTSAVRGSFRDNDGTRAEAMSLIASRRG
jgi:GTP cyclohydrolase I